jgi:hypothetical protein
MNESDLKHILARNPAIRVSDTRQVLAQEPERRTPDALDGVAAGKTTSMGRPSVSFVFYRSRLVDVDALNPKDLLDGLVQAGLLPGDEEGVINLLGCTQVKVAHRHQEETVITIRYHD